MLSNLNNFKSRLIAGLYAPRGLTPRLAILLSLPMLLGACSTITPVPVVHRPLPPPENLVQACSTGPEPPTKPIPMRELSTIVRLRDLAFTECRLRHQGLVEYVDSITKQ